MQTGFKTISADIHIKHLNKLIVMKFGW